MPELPPVAIDWLKEYVDQLMATAKRFGADSKMGQAALLRADHVMDVVEAWKEHCKRHV